MYTLDGIRAKKLQNNAPTMSWNHMYQSVKDIYNDAKLHKILFYWITAVCMISDLHDNAIRSTYGKVYADTEESHTYHNTFEERM